MDVEKREKTKSGELKNKMIVGSILNDSMNDSMNDSKDDGLPQGEWKIVYCVLDLNTGDVVSLLPPTVTRLGRMPSMGAVGSQLYLFGAGNSVPVSGDGGDESTKPKNKNNKKKKKGKNQNNQRIGIGLGLGLQSCHRLDLTKPEIGWRLAAPAAPAVYATHYDGDDDIVDDDGLFPMDVVELGGKFYTFDKSVSGFICSVEYDPHLKEWRHGPHLKNVTRPVTRPVMADWKNNRIMAYFEDISKLYAYYPSPSQGRWECVDDHFNGWFTGGDPVALADDGVIYIYTLGLKEYFRAYHTLTKQYLPVRLSPEAEEGPSYLHYHEYRTLLHRGRGLLCLLDSSLDTPNNTKLHIIQFKVRLVNDDQQVLVTPFSSLFFDLQCACSPSAFLPVV